MKHTEFHITSSDGFKLYFREWETEAVPKGYICLVHGLGEHSGRYEHLANVLTASAYNILAFDLRGHGISEGKRGHIPSYEAFMNDIKLLLEQAHDRYGNIPGFLYGHSMGGNLVLNYALRNKPNLKGVIASGPWLNLAFEPPAFKVKLAQLMNRLWPSFTMQNSLDAKVLYHAPDNGSTYLNDPLVHPYISSRLFTVIYQSGKWALEHAGELNMPLLLMHGGSDRITSPDASRLFAERSHGNCTFKIWDGLYHEIHNEPRQNEVFAAVIEWMNRRLL